MASLRHRSGKVLHDPPFVQTLLANPLAGLLWLPLRVWLGWQWLESGWGKMSNPAWTQTGEAIKGFWTSAVSIPETGRPPIAFEWYRQFLQAMLNAQAWPWFSKLVVAGELLVGAALILGAFTGIAAFVGGFMNWNFMMAGSASVNPMFFVLSVGLILAWKVAGHFGLDYFLLARLGTPWRDRAAESPTTGEARTQRETVRAGT
jgi:thiosulfate dehydrogenase (quinone) large subunit